MNAVHRLCRSALLVLPPLAGFLLAGSSSLAQGFPTRPVPKGMAALPSGGSGVVLTTQMQGSSSATVMFKALLQGIRGYFDADPRILSAARGTRDTEVQASFTASTSGVAVYGFMGVAVQGTSARAVVLYDRPGQLAQSINRLIQVAGGGGGGGGGPVQLTRTGFPDGSGSIGLAPGWRVVNSYKGTVDIVGPQGASMGLGGYQIVVPAQAAGLFPGSPAVSSLDPVRSAVEILQYQARAAGQSVKAQVIDSKPTPWDNGQAAYIRYRIQVGGQSFDGFGLFALTPFDANQFLWYNSYVIAPTQVFPGVLSAALQMWGTWSVSPAVFTERLMAAARSMRETSQIISGANANRQGAYTSINAGWSEYFRGLATLEDPSGNRGRVDQMFAGSVVQQDPQNWRVVPASELVPR